MATSLLLPGQYVRVRLQVGERARRADGAADGARLEPARQIRLRRRTERHGRAAPGHAGPPRTASWSPSSRRIAEGDEVITGNLQKIGPGHAGAAAGRQDRVLRLKNGVAGHASSHARWRSLRPMPRPEGARCRAFLPPRAYPTRPVRSDHLGASPSRQIPTSGRLAQKRTRLRACAQKRMLRPSTGPCCSMSKPYRVRPEPCS